MNASPLKIRTLRVLFAKEATMLCEWQTNAATGVEGSQPHEIRVVALNTPRMRRSDLVARWLREMFERRKSGGLTALVNRCYCVYVGRGS